MENTISKDTLAKRQRAKLERLRLVQRSKQFSPHNIVTPSVIVSQAIKRVNPAVSYNEAQQIAQTMVSAPTDATIKVGNQEIKNEDLQFKIAESIELLNSETNSVQEYFSWFEDCAQIIHDMNDGYVTDSDLANRNEWLDDSYTREAELMVCLGLYRNSSFPGSQEKYNQVYNKLVKLRQLRNAIKECTGNASDETRERIEHTVYAIDPETALQYLRIMKLFHDHEQYWNMSKAQLRKMHMFRGYDDDLDGEYEYFYGQYEPDYNPENTVKRVQYSFMDRLRALILSDNDDTPANSHGEQLRAIFESIMPHNDDQNSIQERISELRKLSRPNASKDRIKAFLASRFRSLSNNLPK